MSLRLATSVLLLFAFVAACGRRGDDTAGAGPLPALRGLTPDGRPQPGETDRCPLCGMLPAARPEHVAALVAADGRTWYFCGDGCMLRTWLHPEIHLGLERTALARCVVQDWFEGAPLDASTAIFVAGSDVVGPMGPAIVALRSESDVDVFRSRHGARETFWLTELDDARWLRVTGRPALRDTERPARD
ncbi:MAG: nitrous oxide reductase accessory protein NosL [Planctomycetes bacterium]|nr:nitrous oxide reductase accessory protein NosL [Planctomycetota bacterium]